MLNISPKSIEITNRFFEAIEELRKRKLIRGLKTFTRKHELNQSYLANIRNHRKNRSIKPEYLSFLAEDFGVSCEWLLLGSGPMFRPTHSRNEESQNLENGLSTHHSFEE